MSEIAIIGVGEIGQALGLILEKAGYSVNYWDKDEGKVYELGKVPKSLPETMAGSGVVFLCVPSWSIHEALAFIGPYLRRGKIVVSLAKGLNDRTHKTLDEVLKKMLPTGVSFVVLGGALIAEEIKAGKTGLALAASLEVKTAKQVVELFRPTDIAVDTSSDVRGVAVMGILKNIYSLGLGITEGLNWGYNERGYFFGAAIKEMITIVQALGGRRETIFRPAILADFVATSFSRDSLNHRVGLDFAKHGEAKEASEGLLSIESLTKIIDRKKLETCPIFYTLARVVVGKIEVQTAFSDLLKIFKGAV